MSSSRGRILVDNQVCAHIEERGFEVRRVFRDDLGPDDLHAELAGVSGYLARKSSCRPQTDRDRRLDPLMFMVGVSKMR